MKVGSAWNWGVETKELFIAVRVASENVVLPSIGRFDLHSTSTLVIFVLALLGWCAPRSPPLRFRSLTDQSIINQRCSAEY